MVDMDAPITRVKMVQKVIIFAMMTDWYAREISAKKHAKMSMIVAYMNFVKIMSALTKSVKPVNIAQRTENVVKWVTLEFAYHDPHVLARIAVVTVLRISIANMERFAY